MITITWKTTDITADVEFEGAIFTTAAGSTPGEFLIQVKDPLAAYDFRAGERLTLDIDGTRYFDGYILEATQRFAFPVIDTSHAIERVRIWELRGPDASILFRRRYVFKQDDPRDPLTGLYLAPNTSDLTYLNAIIDHLTLDDDDLTFDFTAVASPNPDEAGISLSVGDSWENAMRQVAALPGAVWGMRPDRTVYYHDDITETGAFAISDEPDDVTSFGYSDFHWLNDGTHLCNDARVWGVGLGVDHVRLAHVEDSASIAEHGRWTNINPWRTNLYIQAHVDDVAESLVYGSPSHHHGPKDDAVYVRCRVRRSGLLAGDKVRVISNVFDEDMVLPIKRLTVTFANKNEALYDLLLTWEIDAPRTFFDFPPLPGFHRPRFPQIGEPGSSACNDLLLYWIDSGGWETASSYPWLGHVYENTGRGGSGFGTNMANKKRYWQQSSFVDLLTGRYGDGYDETKVYGYSRLLLPQPAHWVIQYQFTVPTYTTSPGGHQPPFPNTTTVSGPYGTQVNTVVPALTLDLRLFGTSFRLVSCKNNVNQVAGPTGRTGTQGSTWNFEWSNTGGGNARVWAVTDQRPASPNAAPTITGDANGAFNLGTAEPFLAGGKWYGSDSSGIYVFHNSIANGISAVSGAQPIGGYPGNAAFDNFFNPDGGEHYASGVASVYTSSSVEDAWRAGWLLSDFQLIQVDGTYSNITGVPPVCRIVPQVGGGGLICEALARQSTTEYETYTYRYISGTTEVMVNGTEQRRGIDYHETDPRTITFTYGLPDGMDVFCCYQVAK